MVNKRLLVGLGCMLVGGVLVVTGLLRVPVVPVVFILMGGSVGFVGYKIFESRRNDKPNDMNFG